MSEKYALKYNMVFYVFFKNVYFGIFFSGIFYQGTSGPSLQRAPQVFGVSGPPGSPCFATNVFINTKRGFRPVEGSLFSGSKGVIFGVKRGKKGREGLFWG